MLRPQTLVPQALPNGSVQGGPSITHTLEPQEVPGLSPQEQTLVDQLQMLLEIHDTDTAQAPALIQQMGMQLITTSSAANAPAPSMTDTMADEAEGGRADGMAVPSMPSDARASPGPTGSVLAALNKVAPDGEEDGPAGSSGRVGIGPLGLMDGTVWGWGQSALQQLHARKVFMNIYAPKGGAGDGTKGAKAVSPPAADSKASTAGRKEPSRKGSEMCFDPMDTLADDDEEEDEDSFGIEGGVSPLILKGQPGGGVKLWSVGKSSSKGKGGKGSASAAGFFGSMSSQFAAKVASKVGGLSQKVRKTTDPLTSRVQQNADAAAAAITSASSIAAQRLQPLGKGAEVAGKAVAAAAASLTSPAVAAAAAAATAARSAAAAAAAAARSAPSKLLGGSTGNNPKSNWVVVDAPPGTMFPSAAHTVRVVVITSSPELTKMIKRMQQQQTTTGLVSFESYKLGVKVPQPVYTEASLLYTTLLPLIIDFVAESPKGRVCFTGTGAGGSLATVLGLMAASRGLRPHCMSPLVVALDAPPVLAEVVSGALWGCGGRQQEACDTADWREMVADITARGLLSELGLPHNAVLNVRTASAPVVPAPMSALAAPLSAAGVAAGVAEGVGSVVSKARDAIPPPSAIVSGTSSLVVAAVAGATSRIGNLVGGGAGLTGTTGVAGAGVTGAGVSDGNGVANETGVGTGGGQGAGTGAPQSTVPGLGAGPVGLQAVVPGGPVMSASDAVSGSTEEEEGEGAQGRGGEEGVGEDVLAGEGRYVRGRAGRAASVGRDGGDVGGVSRKEPQHATLSLFKLVGEVRVQV